MWLWYDWRAAAVADTNGNIIDIEIWDGWKDVDALCSRIDMIANNATTPEAERLLERFPDSKVRVDMSPDCLLYTSPSPRDRG